MGGKPALIVFTEILIAEQQHRMAVPSVLDLPQCLFVQRSAKIDAADFRADLRMQFSDGNCPGSLGDW